MDLEIYDVGDQPLLTGTFYDDAGELANPTAAFVDVRDPSANTETSVPTNVSVGTFTKVVPVDEAGLWAYRFRGTGAVTSSEWNEFLVEPSPFDVAALTGVGAWRPRVSDVAAVVPTRTGSDDDGTPYRSFGSTSRPTAAQVYRLVSQVQGEVMSETGATMPDELVVPSDALVGPASSPAGNVVALGTAARVELQFYPDMQIGPESTGRMLREQYLAAKAALVAAVRTINGGGVVGTDEAEADVLLPRGSFPDTIAHGRATTPWEPW